MKNYLNRIGINAVKAGSKIIDKEKKKQNFKRLCNVIN